MSRFAGLAFLSLVLACGCSQPEVPADPTAEALDQLRSHKYDDAIRSASEAIRQTPTNAAAHLYRGRAYYYRSSMGDAHRAIEDLTTAIRLSPDSSESYYFRALIYRELGQIDLADKDDTRARELDHVSREIFDQLSDATDPNTQINLKPIDPKNLKTESAPTKSASEMYRESAAADAKSKAKEEPADELSGSFAGGRETEIPAPLESDLNKQYRALLGQGISGVETQAPAESPKKDAFGRPLDAPSYTASPLPSTENGAQTEPAARSTGTWNRPVAPIQSPFAQRAPAGNITPGMLPNTTSPFPQAARHATGYVPPTSPFGGAQTPGGASVTRPYSTTVRPQNNAVRPLYPRDYTP